MQAEKPQDPVCMPLSVFAPFAILKTVIIEPGLNYEMN
jgi:hypothetical protein